MKRDVVVIGAGIAGVSVAHYLLAADPGCDVLIVDREPPLSQTTARSGENFRGPWPDPGMAALAGRSIVLMESLGAEVGLKFSGYDFVSEGAGAGRFLPAGSADGVRCWDDPAAIRARFPYLSASISRVTRLERAGAVDVHALGSALLRAARRAGAGLLAADVTAIEPANSGYRLDCASAAGRLRLDCERLVLAAGPFNGRLAAHLGLELPIENFLQRKIVVPDPLGAVPRDCTSSPTAASESSWAGPTTARRRNRCATRPGTTTSPKSSCAGPAASSRRFGHTSKTCRGR
jgi:glycine/D-amino acid oxidase-like deaminating enzyme